MDALLKIWLFAVYPVAAVMAGVIAWLVIAWQIPAEPHPALYGAGSAVLTLAFFYVHAIWYLRKRKQTNA